jgi:hypothetical protein
MGKNGADSDLSVPSVAPNVPKTAKKAEAAKAAVNN